MRVWSVVYKNPMASNEIAIVIAVTAGDAIKKCCKKLRLGPHRIQCVERIGCDEIVLK